MRSRWRAAICRRPPTTAERSFRRNDRIRPEPWRDRAGGRRGRSRRPARDRRRPARSRRHVAAQRPESAGRPLRRERHAVVVAGSRDAARDRVRRRPRDRLPQPLGTHAALGRGACTRAGAASSRHQSERERAAACGRIARAGRRRRAARDHGRARFARRAGAARGPWRRDDRASEGRSGNGRADCFSSGLACAVAALRRGRRAGRAARRDRNRPERAVDDARPRDHRNPQPAARPERRLRLLAAEAGPPDAAALARRPARAHRRDPAPRRRGALVRHRAVLHPARRERIRLRRVVHRARCGALSVVPAARRAHGPLRRQPGRRAVALRDRYGERADRRRAARRRRHRDAAHQRKPHGAPLPLPVCGGTAEQCGNARRDALRPRERYDDTLCGAGRRPEQRAGVRAAPGRRRRGRRLAAGDGLPRGDRYQRRRDPRCARDRRGAGRDRAPAARVPAGFHGAWVPRER